MRIAFCCLILFLGFSCNGTLTEEQRKNFQKEKKEREIKQVKDDEVYKKAQEMGSELITFAEANGAKKASEKCSCTVKLVESGSDKMNKVEKILWEAYSSAGQSDINVQKNRTDIIIVSKPLMDESLKVWFVNLPKKQIILAL